MTGLARAGQSHVPRVEHEVALGRQPKADRVEQVRRQIEHPSTDPTSCMQVLLGGDGTGEVKCGGTVAHVHVDDHAQLSQELQGPVHRRKVDTGVPKLDLCAQLGGAGVATAACERCNDGPTSPRDAMALSPKLIDGRRKGAGDEHLVARIVGDRREICGHPAVSPHHRI